MPKKYLPFIALVLAAYFLYWVVSHQRKNIHPVWDDKKKTEHLELRPVIEKLHTDSVAPVSHFAGKP